MKLKNVGQSRSAPGPYVETIHTIVPPARRNASARRLMLGTISRAIGISATAPGATNPVCMSTTSSAVLLGSMAMNGCTRPRRRIDISMACCAISILCTVWQLLLAGLAKCALEFQDDLPEVLTLAHVFERCTSLGPREDAIDHRAHLVQRDRAVHMVE